MVDDGIRNGGFMEWWWTYIYFPHGQGKARQGKSSIIYLDIYFEPLPPSPPFSRLRNPLAQTEGRIGPVCYGLWG